MILGVIASITIPAVVRNQIEAQNRTKLKKCMTVYDTALNKIVIENGIKSDTALVNWADSNTKNDCTNTSAYFKVARNLEVNGNSSNCKFRATDGVFWDISDIKKPLVALREQDLNDETAQSDTNRAFYMFGWFDEQGSLRSNDMGKIDATNKADLEKLYDFIAGKTKTSMAKVSKINAEEYNSICDNECILAKYDSYKNTQCENPIEIGWTCINCVSCKHYNKMDDVYQIFDEHGIPIIRTTTDEKEIETLGTSVKKISDDIYMVEPKSYDDGFYVMYFKTDGDTYIYWNMENCKLDGNEYNCVIKDKSGFNKSNGENLELEWDDPTSY